ncbi:Adenylate cyclase [Ceratocystis fimbriata CBS 114723]|uniref:Adenylate cyclase n=1 Tax=Ceratocystis fimbriata CBS 114723 TaxID=1035309 RepID=A0A2C5XA40_9PEZI|nr:Adenylate cyclase [Ceratocystis fimbriata CBS 114723]
MPRHDAHLRFSSITSSSASTDSTKSSTSTVRQPSNRRPQPTRLNTESATFINDEQQISPTTAHASNLVHSPTSITQAGSNRNSLQQLASSGAYRRDPSSQDPSGTDHNLAMPTHQNSFSSIPQIQHNPPTAIPDSSSQIPPWMSPPSNAAPGSNNGLATSFFNDSSDNISTASQLSPGFRNSLRADQISISSGAHNGRDSPDIDFYDTHRRPSQASIATASSQGSGMNRGGLKKLQGFFGEEFPGRDSFEAPTSSSRDARSRSFSQSRGYRDRNHSNATDHTRDASPSSSRPRTPVPAPEVVPFLYQDQDDIARYGEAPVRDVMAGPDRDRYMSDGSVQAPPKTSASNRSGPSTIMSHSHRHNKSNDDPRALRTTTSRDEQPATSSQGSRDRSHRDRGGSATTLYSSKSRAQSPAPGQTVSRDGPSSPNNNHSKRGGVFRRLIHGKSKEDKDSGSPSASRLIQSSSSRSMTHKSSRQEISRAQVSPGYASSYYTPSLASSTTVFSNTDVFEAPDTKQRQQTAFSNKFPFAKRPRTARTYDEESIGPTDKKGTAFFLDTNLGDMSGVITPEVANLASRNDSFPRSEVLRRPTNGSIGSFEEPPGSWNAPDSWGVRRTTGDASAEGIDTDEMGRPYRTEEKVVSYCIRIFRGDGTFATISSPLSATVSDVIGQLIRKMYGADSSDNYHIVLKTHDLFRILKPSERPLALQKRLLEQAGYKEQDRIPDIGREDNSYLCRFMFLSSIDPLFSKAGIDPALTRITKPAHIDLSGRNIATIPIPLFKRTDDILSLNLSRNLALDIPRDFISACHQLRDIKYNNNEVRRLPLSFSRAVKLTFLDAGNNFIETLEGAELEELTGLLKMSFANNRLTSLPPYFDTYKVLRYLNLSSNFIDKFPKFICDLESLLDLDISFNAIAQLPEEIGKLKTLERFFITNNRLSHPLPPSFKEMDNLREFDCKYNMLDNIDILSELPRLEIFSADHNQISRFCGTFAMLRNLRLNSNPLTIFELEGPVMTLKVLNLSNGKLTSIDKSFAFMPNLESLIADKNFLSMLSPQISNLRRLEHLSISCNRLSELPPQIGCLTELKVLDVHSNNLMKLPMELWWANKLEVLNVSSNVLDSFPKPASKQPRPFGEENMPPPSLKTGSPPSLTTFPSSETLDESRRPSQSSSTLLSVGAVPVSPGADRKGSVVSVYGKGRNTKVISRNPSQTTLSTSVTARKDSSSTNSRKENTFAGSLRSLCLADNRLDDDVFQSLVLLPELRSLNLSYNEIGDIPQRALQKWPQITELYMSRNELTTLPADDINRDTSVLQFLYLNGNKFTNLTADISNARKLAVLDCGSNWLKYNISNVPYDWNWILNPELRYLNLSGNKRMEIKQTPMIPGYSHAGNRESYSDFSTLQNLRVLGLMDVTLTAPRVPDQSEDRRVRTSASQAGHLPYGMADTLGRSEHLSTMDLVVPRFNGSDTEILLGLFDGQALSQGGSKLTKYLHENFANTFTTEIKVLSQRGTDTPTDALRRSFLTLNRDLINVAIQNSEDRPATAHRSPNATNLVLTPEDRKSGAVATVAYLKGTTLYVANVGDVQAMLISDNDYCMLSHKHDPAEETERRRIREAGGWVSRSGKLNDILGVSRAFGYHELMPSVMAAPHISEVQLSEHNDVLLMATRDLWEYLDPKLVVDIYRSERHDLMLASQKLRDLAMAHGATGKLMVMMLSVSDMKRRVERSRLHRGQSMTRYPSGIPDEFLSSRRTRKAKGDVLDSTLQRLEAEIPAPTGTVAIVFTDIKNSTTLWEMYPNAMRSAIKLHNEVMRRQLRRIGGYEVKTEGDAFMVSFPTATSALLWCFAVQNQLLQVNWPAEVLNSLTGQPVFNKNKELIFKGLSVRMGIHYGECVSETDPVTRRMDYFGPMVNKAARVSGVADGGQITVSTDFIQEIQRSLEAFQEDQSMLADDEDTFDEETYLPSIRKDLRSLSSQGFEVKEMGERKLKGLENPEVIYSLYPHGLAGRIEYHQAHDRENNATELIPTNKAVIMSAAPGTQMSFDPEIIWALWHVSLRLEMLCSCLENSSRTVVIQPETAILDRFRQMGGEFGESIMLSFMAHQVSRIESSITTLSIRHLAMGGGVISELDDLRAPIADLLGAVAGKLAEAERYKELYGPLRGQEYEAEGEYESEAR